MHRRPPHTPLRRAALSVLGTLAVLVTAVQPAGAAPRSGGQEPVGRAFTGAAAEFGVPRDLLIALGYGETHLDDHAGLPLSLIHI